MPSYDLMCEDCGCKFSVFCSISDKKPALSAMQQ